MANNTTAEYLQNSYDGLILVHPQVQILESVSNEIQGAGIACLNIGKALSAALMNVSMDERSRFSQKWLLDTLSEFHHVPVLCTCPDLLFEPSLKIDPLALLRQTARHTRIIVLWLGEYSAGILSYAIPEHHHFRTWKISDLLTHQPTMVIHRIPNPQGA